MFHSPFPGAFYIPNLKFRSSVVHEVTLQVSASSTTCRAGPECKVSRCIGSDAVAEGPVLLLALNEIDGEMQDTQTLI
jgi:hypothetical protein